MLHEKWFISERLTGKTTVWDQEDRVTHSFNMWVLGRPLCLGKVRDTSVNRQVPCLVGAYVLLRRPAGDKWKLHTWDNFRKSGYKKTKWGQDSRKWNHDILQRVFRESCLGAAASLKRYRGKEPPMWGSAGRAFWSEETASAKALRLTWAGFSPGSKGLIRVRKSSRGWGEIGTQEPDHRKSLGFVPSVMGKHWTGDQCAPVYTFKC